MVCIKPGVFDSEVLVGESFSSAMRGNISPGNTIPDGVLTRAEELDVVAAVAREASHIIVSSIRLDDDKCCSHCSIKRLQAEDADDMEEVVDCCE